MHPKMIRLLAVLAQACVITISAVCEPQVLQAHVAVLPIVNDTGVASYDAACATVTDTLTLTLRLLGRYDVVSVDDKAFDSSDAALAARASNQNVDYFIHGSIGLSASKDVTCHLEVYDRAKGRSAINREATSDLLGLFDASDSLVAQIVGDMTGIHIGFGSISLTRGGEAGSYTVYIDGIRLGDDLASIDHVLNGKRNLRIVQRRMLGEFELAHETIDVAEGQTRSLAFSVPYLLPEEREKIESLQASIDAALTDPKAGAILEGKFAEEDSLLADLSYSPKLARYKDIAREQRSRWTIEQNRVAIESSAWAPASALVDALLPLYVSAGEYPDPSIIRSGCEGNARLLATLFELDAGKRIGEGDYAGALEDYNSILAFARLLPPERLSEYAGAATYLSSVLRSSSRDLSSVEAVFGSRIEAGRRFAAMKKSIALKKSHIVLGTDLGLELKAGQAAYAAPPLLVGRDLPADSGILPFGFAPERAVALGKDANDFVLIEDGYKGFGALASSLGSGATQLVTTSLAQQEKKDTRPRTSLSGGATYSPGIPGEAEYSLGWYGPGYSMWYSIYPFKPAWLGLVFAAGFATPALNTQTGTDAATVTTSGSENSYLFKAGLCTQYEVFPYISVYVNLASEFGYISGGSIATETKSTSWDSVTQTYPDTKMTSSVDPLFYLGAEAVGGIIFDFNESFGFGGAVGMEAYIGDSALHFTADIYFTIHFPRSKAPATPR
jgi:TolB-like protein